ncbi:MAG: ABC transporter permease [Lachnospiraceae bacterium]|nr:ABC transporter permease [Lachnospiraceae bacterium]
MTSRNWFFKLSMEDLKHRLWSIALSCLIYFFAFPIATLIVIGQTRHSTYSMMLDPVALLSRQNREILNTFREMTAYGESGLFTFLVLFFALVFAFSGFSYLHSSKKTDFYHNLPIRREKWFAVIAADSFIICMVPYLVMGLLATLLVVINCGSTLPLYFFFTGFVANALYFCMIFLFAVVALMLTGNLFVGGLAVGVFFFYGPLLLGVIEGLFMQFETYFTPEPIWDRWALRVSPVFWGFSTLFGETRVPSLCRFLFFTLLWSVALALLALFLYKKRPSEAAGNAMAFKVTKAPIKFLLTIPIGLACALVIDSSLYDQNVWTLFALFCGVTFTYCIMEIIYHADFKKLFAHKLHLIICLLIAFAIFGVFRLDLFGYDRYVPSEKDFVGAAVAGYELENNSSDLLSSYEIVRDPETQEPWYVNWDGDYDYRHSMETISIQDYELIRQLAENGVKDTRYCKGRSSEEFEDDDSSYSLFYFAFRKENGSVVYRKYLLNTVTNAQLLAQVYADPSYKEGTYPLLDMDPIELAGVNVETIWGQEHISFPDEETMQKLLTTYQKELMSLSYEQRHQPILGCLQFKSHQFQKDADEYRRIRGYIDYFNEHFFYPVFPCFQETLAMLEDLGYSLDNPITEDMILSAEISNYMCYWDTVQDDDMLESYSYTDPEKIRQLLEHSAFTSFHYWQDMSDQVGGLDLYFNVSPSEAASHLGSDASLANLDSENGNLNIHAYFIEEVPDFVLRDMQIDDESVLEYLK